MAQGKETTTKNIIDTITRDSATFPTISEEYDKETGMTTTIKRYVKYEKDEELGIKRTTEKYIKHKEHCQIRFIVVESKNTIRVEYDDAPTDIEIRYIKYSACDEDEDEEETITILKKGYMKSKESDKGITIIEKDGDIYDYDEEEYEEMKKKIKQQEKLLQKQISRLEDPNEKLIKEYIKSFIVVGNEEPGALLQWASLLASFIKDYYKKEDEIIIEENENVSGF
jgi:hypothetical protein